LTERLRQPGSTIPGPFLIEIKNKASRSPYPSPFMGNVVFKCPGTGLNVQHWLEEPKPGDPQSSYESVICKACTRLHFINRSTGTLLGEEDTPSGEGLDRN